MRIGAHVSVAGTFAEGARRAKKLGCECMQIFAGPPRNYSRPMPSDEDAQEFCELVREYDLKPVVVHASYLLHLISAKPSTAKASLGLYKRELEVAGALGADYYVLHPGSAAGRDRDEVIKLLAEVMTSADVAGPMVLVENSANTNAGIGAHFEEIAAILEAVADPKRFAMAFDTAHATGAGYDVSSAQAVAKTLKHLYKCVGRKSVKIVHANDSKGAVGSNRDLHQHIGEGEVGTDGFKALFADKTLGKLPFILETPIDEPGDDERNIGALRRLAGPSKKKG